MDLFKNSKNKPIKLKNYKFIGYHEDYPTACYYYKELPFNNFNLMECMLEGKKLNEIGAGTNVKIIDAFMSYYLKYIKGDFVRSKLVENVIKDTYTHFDEKQQDAMIKQFNSAVPKEVKESLNEYKKDGFKTLYCSNDETKDRFMAIVNIVLVKEVHLKSNDERIKIDRKFTIFKPFKFRVTPSYLKGQSKTKYMMEEIPQIVVNHDLLK